METYPALGALHHIGIVVTAGEYELLVASLCQWFCGGVVDSGEDDPLDIRWAWVTGPGGLIIEPVAPRSSSETPITRFLARTGGGLHHVSFETHQLGSCSALLEHRGAPTVGHNPDHGGWAEFFIAPDQTGNALLHWMQRVQS